MPDQPIRGSLRALDDVQRDVLYLLTTEMQPIWSVEDLGRAIEDRAEAVSAVDGLRCAGLLFQTSDGHVFASHAGYRAVAVIGAVV